MLFLNIVLFVARVARSEFSLAPNPSPQSKACIPPAGGSPSKDDTPGIIQTIKQCGKGATITFPTNSTYHVNSPLTVTGCNGCTVRIDGIIKASGSSKNWEKSRCIVLFKNSSGLKIDASGTLDGSGQEAYVAPQILNLAHIWTAGNDLQKTRVLRDRPCSASMVDKTSASPGYE